MWPQLYRDSRDFQEKKRLVKLSPLEHLQQIHSATLSEADLAQLDLSIWASVTPPNEETTMKTSMGLAFHDHPLALLSGVFYASADLVGRPHPYGFCRPSWNDALPLHEDA